MAEVNIDPQLVLAGLDLAILQPIRPSAAIQTSALTPSRTRTMPVPAPSLTILGLLDLELAANGLGIRGPSR
jgi:hypothetical protein